MVLPYSPTKAHCPIVRTKESMAATRSVWVVIGRPIGVLLKRKIGARPIMVSVQEMIACREVIRSAPNPKMRNTTLRKANPICGRRQQKAELERDVAGNLEDRQIVVFEPVVEVGFRQHDKDRDQSDAGKEIGRRNDDRDGAGVAIDQQHRGDERVADALHGQHLAALADPALQYFQRQSDRRGRPVGALPLKQ